MKSVGISIFQNQYFWLFTLSILSHEVQGGRESGCGGISCQSPPEDAICDIVSKSDRSIPRPSGPHAECCPLWKCKDDKASKRFYTYHGLNGTYGTGGTERVSYDRSNGSSMVRSMATGDHDAVANAGGNSGDIQATLDAILSQLQFKR